MQLPDRMLPWLNWLSQFDAKLAHVVDEYVDRMSGDAMVRLLSPDKIIYGVNRTNKGDSF